MNKSFLMRLLLLIVLPPGVVAAQSALPKNDIPAIARLANGSVVSIVMSDKDGKPIAQGSGFFVSKDGLIVTNYHVIAEGTSAVVKLPDGAFYAVDGVLTFDKARDIAVIKAHGHNFQTLTPGNSNRVQVGEGVVAIGNPLSLESTVSNGIVSGIRTSNDLGGKFLQITTPISPGSSGGPLFNMSGEVVGITTMHLKGGENLNFAIPINDAKRLFSLPPLPPGFQLDSKTFPNETESSVAPTRDDNAPHSAPIGDGEVAQQTAPAYQSYLELLRSGDITFRVSAYACFDDDPQSKTFLVINANIYDDKRTMTVTTYEFTSGVSRIEGMFEGQLTAVGGNGFFLLGTLHTLQNNKDDPSHETDDFEWGPDVLAMRAGFGELLPGQARLSYEFKMQRSTGRYTEQTVFTGVGADGFTIDKTGKCLRIPNSHTPEETYQSLQ